MRAAVAALLLSSSAGTLAKVAAVDDTGRTVTLDAPARRIVSLAPHVTEMLFAGGAGKYIVGVTEFSDFPPEARQLSSVGSGVALDLERVLALKPDLVVGWNSGNTAAQLEKLAALGVPVFKSDPRDFAAIASSMERLAHLAGTDAAGEAAANRFRQQWQQLRSDYAHRTRVSVFYQIWRRPLMTLNGTHMVSAAITLCGGNNIFAGLPQVVPTVNAEAVLKADPDAIIASSGAQDDAFAAWRAYPRMTAVRHGNLLTVDGNLLNRSGPRILDGVEDLCRQLDVARSHLH